MARESPAFELFSLPSLLIVDLTSQEGVDFWRLYALYNIKDWSLSTIDKVEVLKQAPKLLALFFVVAFGSSLDVAAIQAGMSDPLDFNHELKTVGEAPMLLSSKALVVFLSRSVLFLKHW